MKKSLFLLILLLTATMFTGCVANKRKAQNFNVLSIEDIKDKETSITFLVRSGVISTALVDLEAEFEAEYPYIDVKVKALTGGYDDIRSTTLLDINSKNKETADLVIGYPDHFVEYYSAGALVDLQYFIQDKNVGFSKDEMADFLESYLKENRGYDDQYPEDLYGLPFNKSTEVMVYNKTAFKELFGEGWESKVPKTWQEVATISEEIITKVKAGELDKVFVESVDPETEVTTYLKVSDYLSDPDKKKFIPFGYDSSDNGFITLTRQFGGKYTERVNVEKGYVRFNNTESKAAMAYFKDLNNKGYFGTAANFGASYNSDAFKLIQVLMTVGSSAGVGYNASKKYEYELGVAPIPYYNEDAKYVIQQGTNIGMINLNTDEEKLASWLFLKFLMRPEKTAQFAMATGGYLPVRKSAYETEAYSEYLTNPSDDKINHSAAANVALKDYIEKNYTFFVDDAFVGSAKVRTEAGYIFNSIIVNNEDITKRFDEAYKTLTPFVEKK